MNNYFSQSCNALTTGYDRSGIKNYAYSASVPGFSMTGSQPFTLLATLSPRSVQRGSIFRQDGIFEMGFENGLLYIDAPGICTVKYPREVMSFVPDIWYTFTITFNGSKLSVYVEGLPAAETDRTATAVASSGTYYEMGTDLEAYIRQVLLYPLDLTPEEVHSGFLNAPVRTGECAAWFDFCGEHIAERSGKGVSVSVKGFAKVVNICRVLSSSGGMTLYAPFDVVHPEEKGYTWTAKIYPQRTKNERMCIGANSDAERTSGWMLWLQKESDDVFRVCLRTGGSKGTILTSDKTVSTYCWIDVAWTYDGTKITLYLDGEAVGTATGIKAGILQGDGRTTFCGLTSRGKTDVKYAYSGYVAYVAELGKCVIPEVLTEYKTKRPYVLDEGIAGVFDFTDTNLTEKCTLQTFSVNGQAAIAWAENTNLLTDPQQLAFYMPGEDNPYWESLSDELKWEVELYGLIVNNYLRDVLGYELDAANEKWYCSAAAYIVENGLKTPEFQEIVKEGPLIQPKTLSTFGAALAVGGTLVALGGFIGKACKAGAKIGTALVTSRVILSLIVAAAATAAIMGIAKGISKIVEHNKKRPKSKRVRILSIQFNHNSNPATGGIHIRRDNLNAIEPPEWVENRNNEANPACCAYVRKPVAIFIQVRVLLESDDPNIVFMANLTAVENGAGILGGLVSDNFQLVANVPVDVNIFLQENQLNNLPNIPMPPVNGWWNWHCRLDNEAIFVCNTFHRVYQLLGQPVNPWIFQEGPYNLRQRSYPWTTAMDVTAKICAAEVNNGEGEFLERLARGLNGNPYLKYNMIRRYTVQSASFNIVKFQNDFNTIPNRQYFLNCEDCATIVATYANLHGNRMIQIRLEGQHEVEDEIVPNFMFNKIKVIGYNDVWIPQENNEFEMREFIYHQISCSYVDMMDFSQMEITDACLQLDTGTFPHGNNLELKNAAVPVGMQFANNGNPEVLIDEEQPYVLQMYRERLVRNNNACYIASVYPYWNLAMDSAAPQPEREECVVKIASIYDIGLEADREKAALLPDSFIPAANGLQYISQQLIFSKRVNYTCRYKDTDIEIDCIVSENISDTNYQLASLLSGVSIMVPSMREKGIELGDRAFAWTSDGQYCYIAMSRRNIVLQLMCSTPKITDLLPLAYELDRQIQVG